MFAEQDELQAYTRHVIDKHRLEQKTRTNANVKQVQWCEDERQWHVYLDGGDIVRAQFVINASGPLSTPVIPNFPGRDSFKGHSFHTNNWDHDYDYRGKRVAVIGVGASSAQVVPAIAPDVKALHVFQRTPHWVIPRPDYRFKPWQRKLLKNRWASKLLRRTIYWSLEARVIGFKYSKTVMKLVLERKARKHIKRQIADPQLQKMVTPDYTIGCKRVIISSTLYPTYCRDNVSLHGKHQGIREITETGISTTDGQHIELDLIVYSTGYDATDGVISYPVVGKQGVTMADSWQVFPRAYMGTMVPEFPNLFVVTGPNTGIGHTSAIFIIEAQMHYIMSCIDRVEKQGAQSIEVKREAEDKYTTHIHREMEKTVWKTGGCNSWYQSKSGHVIAMFPGFSYTFLRWAKSFRTDDHSIN
jgi:cation diffusion facilitator CzcD-associated flavoprotein CzcO